MSLSADPQVYSGWMSPTAIDWPGAELNGTCVSTPLSSPITPFGGSRNCFDDSFQAALSIGDEMSPAYASPVATMGHHQIDASLPVWDASWKDSTELQPGSSMCGPQFQVEHIQSYGHPVGSECMTSSASRPSTELPYIPPGRSSQFGKESPGHKQGSRKNSTKRSTAWKIKEGGGHGGLAKKEKHRNSTGQSLSTRPSHQLRSAKNTQKKSLVSSKEVDMKDIPSSQTVNNGRASHNLVEKQYRNRLNSQFNTLLSSIPSEVIGTEITGYGGEDGPERRVSKAEILILAKRHIETLERKNEGLEEARAELKGTVKELKGVWVDSGGGLLL